MIKLARQIPSIHIVNALGMVYLKLYWLVKGVEKTLKASRCHQGSLLPLKGIQGCQQ